MGHVGSWQTSLQARAIGKGSAMVADNPTGLEMECSGPSFEKKSMFREVKREALRLKGRIMKQEGLLHWIVSRTLLHLTSPCK